MRRKTIIILALILIIAAIFGYNYIYQEHRDIESEVVEFSMSSSKIESLFSEDMTSAEQKFLDKTIEISGLISEINTNDITIDDRVFCQFSENIETSLNTNDNINIKGRVIGYDNLLEQVKLDQCSIIE